MVLVSVPLVESSQSSVGWGELIIMFVKCTETDHVHSHSHTHTRDTSYINESFTRSMQSIHVLLALLD